MHNGSTALWRAWAMALLVAIFSVLAYGVALLNQNVDTATKNAEQSSQFLENFSDYMHCLVVVDEPAYAKLGKDAYFAECDKLLFRGTGIPPHERQPVPTTTSTTD